MTILRSALLTLALVALLVVSLVGQRATAAPTSDAGTLQQAGERYFSAAAARPVLVTSAAAVRGYTQRAALWRAQQGLAETEPVAYGAVSGAHAAPDGWLDIAAARWQARQVAAARGLPAEAVLALVAHHTEYRTPLDPGRVNVLMLNVALDGMAPAEVAASR